MNQRRLSVQGALNYTGNLIKRLIDSFTAAENALIALFPESSSSEEPKPMTSWAPLSPLLGTSVSAPSLKDPIVKADVIAYVQLLKDCIVGTLNWIYETELYFGKKGDEIRTFHWIFLYPKVENKVDLDVPGS
jgi:hypothetical protein